MKKIGILAIVSLLSVVGVVTPCLRRGCKPHFIGSPTITKSRTTGLTVSRKAAGWMTFQQRHYSRRVRSRQIMSV